MRQVRDLIGAQGAAAAGMIGPAKHSRLEEGAIDDQLSAALEQVEQANLTRRPFELVVLLHRRPRHPATLSGQCITGVSEGLLLHEHLLACSLPLLLRHDRGRLHRRMPFRVLFVCLFASCLFICLSRHSCFLPSWDFELRLCSSCGKSSRPTLPVHPWRRSRQRLILGLISRMDTSFTSEAAKLQCLAPLRVVTGQVGRFLHPYPE